MSKQYLKTRVAVLEKKMMILWECNTKKCFVCRGYGEVRKSQADDFKVCPKCKGLGRILGEEVKNVG